MRVVCKTCPSFARESLTSTMTPWESALPLFLIVTLTVYVSLHVGGWGLTLAPPKTKSAPVAGAAGAAATGIAVGIGMGVGGKGGGEMLLRLLRSPSVLTMFG